MALVRLQDLRRRLYGMAKADKAKRFGDLYAHVSELETLRAGYDLAKRNNGAPGIDGVTFEAIEAAGVDAFLRNCGTSWSPAPTGRCEIGGSRFRRTTGRRSAC